MASHGKNTSVLYGAYDLSAYFNSMKVGTKVPMAATTTFQAAAETYLPGIKDGTVSLSGLFDGAAGAVDEVLTAALAGSDQVFTGAVDLAAIGKRCRMAAAQSSAYDVDDSISDAVQVSLDIQANGGVDYGLILHALGSVSATANDTSQDNAAASSNGGVAHLHVVTNTRNGTLVAKVQHSTDNSSWADLITFTTVTSSTTAAERIAVTGTVNRYVRAQYTIAGSTGAMSFQMAFARR